MGTLRVETHCIITKVRNSRLRHQRNELIFSVEQSVTQSLTSKPTSSREFARVYSSFTTALFDRLWSLAISLQAFLGVSVFALYLCAAAKQIDKSVVTSSSSTLLTSASCLALRPPSFIIKLLRPLVAGANGNFVVVRLWSFAEDLRNSWTDIYSSVTRYADWISLNHKLQRINATDVIRNETWLSSKFTNRVVAVAIFY